MTDVYLWFSPQGEGLPAYQHFDIWFAEVVDRSEVNATAPGTDPQPCKDFIVESWNRQTPDDQRTVDDFTFIDGPAPEQPS